MLIITINDNIAPTASDLQTIIVDCIDNVPSPDIASDTDATDNCSNPTITFVSDTQVDFKCGGSIIRIYNVADDCGNSIDISQIINIEDESQNLQIANQATFFMNKLQIRLLSNLRQPNGKYVHQEKGLIVSKSSNLKENGVFEFINEDTFTNFPVATGKFIHIKDYKGNYFLTMTKMQVLLLFIIKYNF